MIFATDHAMEIQNNQLVGGQMIGYINNREE
jgi:hypothetical protein